MQTEFLRCYSEINNQLHVAISLIMKASILSHWMMKFLLRGMRMRGCISCPLLFMWVSYVLAADSSLLEKWTCTCSIGSFGTLDHFPASNCSTSCNCRREKDLGSNGEGWSCLCAYAGNSRVYGSHITNCFTSCNCTSNVPNLLATTKEHVSSKLVIVILLLCIVLTSIAFFASLACYFNCKDRFRAQPALSSSDKNHSWNSAANLLSHQFGMVPGFQMKRNSHFSPVKGFLSWASGVLTSSPKSLPGIILQFSYLELVQATGRFSNDNLVGLGGSSKVYRGLLKDGRIVAIKRFNLLGSADADSEFLSEIDLISRLNHCHVVPFLGYCAENQGNHVQRFLVFEYMKNGNLRDCLDANREGKETMDWGTRVSVALGAARGLEYLHEAAAPRVLHRDIKSTNILLDENYRAKITDLGMAKRLSADDVSSSVSSPARMMGTFGYFAPEYAIIGKASLKSDVFSFGVVILELITGRQPIIKSSNKGDESLVIWAMSRLRDTKLTVSELPDPLLKRNFPPKEMQLMAHLARECLQWDPDSRPTMSEVVHILSSISHDKSKHRNFTVNLFSGSSSCDINNNTEMARLESSESLIERGYDQVTLGKWQVTDSLALSGRQNICNDNRKYDETVLSIPQMEKLLQLTTTSDSWHASEDETVDLTEPRFESFVQAHVVP